MTVPIRFCVRSGDTLTWIMRKFALHDISDIRTQQGFVPNAFSLYTGQMLYIWIARYGDAYHTILDGETIESISAKYNQSQEAFLTANHLEKNCILKSWFKVENPKIILIILKHFENVQKAAVLDV